MKKKYISESDFKKRMQFMFEYKVNETPDNSISYDDDETPKDFTLDEVLGEEAPADEAKNEPKPVDKPKPVAKPVPAKPPVSAPKPIEKAPIPASAAPIAPETASTDINEPIIPNEPAPVNPKKVDGMKDVMHMQVDKMQQIVNSIQSIDSKMAELDAKIQKYDTEYGQLKKDVEEVKEPSDVEKLELRSLDSFPFNQSLKDYWGDKINPDQEKLDANVVKTGDNNYEIDSENIPKLSDVDIKKSFDITESNKNKK